MSAWPKGIYAITLFVEDLEVAKRFYQGVFGLSVKFEDDDSAVFTFGDTDVNLMDRPWGIRTAGFMDPCGHILEIAT